jgi:hypothetical protein
MDSECQATHASTMTSDADDERAAHPRPQQLAPGRPALSATPGGGLGMVIGDVAGSGLPAAAIMGRMRVS